MEYSLKTQGAMLLSPHFRVREFLLRSGSYDKGLINTPTLPNMLENIMKEVKATMAIISSGYRTPTYSVKVGGYANDQHTKGNAADIRFYRGKTIISNREIAAVAERLGVRGIGLMNNNYIHLDTRTSGKWFGNEATGQTYTTFQTSLPVQPKPPIIVAPAVPVFKVGQRVMLKSTAWKYATGQLIPLQYKLRLYTIQQVKPDRVLIKELYSWVYKKDLK